MIAQRELGKSQGGGPQGGHGGMGGMGGMGMDRMGPGPTGNIGSIPPSLLNNPNIPTEIIHGLQAGRIGNTVFVANVRIPEFYHSFSLFYKISHVWNTVGETIGTKLFYLIRFVV